MSCRDKNNGVSLTKPQRTFVRNVAKGKSYQEAYDIAYQNSKSASSVRVRNLLENKNIKHALKNEIAVLDEEIEQLKIREQLQKMAFDSNTKAADKIKIIELLMKLSGKGDDGGIVDQGLSDLTKQLDVLNQIRETRKTLSENDNTQ